MQTRFEPRQLTDPDIAESERVLRKCVHCGFCTATCPTYVLLGDELDSPRGRIYLIKDMLENERPATAEVARHLDRCLSCLACMTTCPSGVHYQHLIDHARVHVERTFRRPWRDRLLRAALAHTLPSPARFRFALVLARLARPFSPLLPQRLRTMLALVRDGSPASDEGSSAGRSEGRAASPASPTRLRVALLEGCVQSVLSPQINAAAKRVLERAGAEVVSVPGCCGAIVHHLGRAAQNRSLAHDLLAALGGREGIEKLDAIVATASGCGTHAKDYGFLFRAEPELAPVAAAFSTRARDITEVLNDLGLPPPRRAAGMTVAYHSACSMQHGQKLEAPPRELLRAAGYTLREIPEGHLCCGSAGTYNVLQPELAARLRERKLGNIGRVAAEVVAAGNVGCIVQLRTDRGVPVVHTVELLDWATGGPRPAALGTQTGSGPLAEQGG